MQPPDDSIIDIVQNKILYRVSSKYNFKSVSKKEDITNRIHYIAFFGSLYLEFALEYDGQNVLIFFEKTTIKDMIMLNHIFHEIIEGVKQYPELAGYFEVRTGLKGER